MTNQLLRGLMPTHPGEVLREDVLPALKPGKAEIARLLGISRPTLYAILNEKQPITSQMALRLAKLTGTTPEMWLNMQQAYDLRISKAELAEQLENIPQLEAV